MKRRMRTNLGKSIFEKYLVKCILKVGTKKMCVEKKLRV